ncbi:MAG TPA: hypothetical protein VJ792_04230 [Candidatus Nitrosotalea sp.]|nr:hypothetical protein [Candidatus Nitrosotalea sp.]
MKNTTTVAVSKKTREELAKKGRFGQSFDDIISDLLQGTEQ